MDFSSQTISGSFVPRFGKGFDISYVLSEETNSIQRPKPADGPRQSLPAPHCPCPASPGHPGLWPSLPGTHSVPGSRSHFSCWGHLGRGEGPVPPAGRTVPSTAPEPGTVPSQMSPPLSELPQPVPHPAKPGLPWLTVVQGDEEDPLDHVVDVELLAELSLRAERAADLGHRIVAVVQALGHAVVGVILTDGRLLACATEPSASRGTALSERTASPPSPGPAPAPAPASTSAPVSCRSCCCFWMAAKCLAAATEPKRAAKGLLEMLLLFSWSVISPQGRAIRVSRSKAAGRTAVRARARSPSGAAGSSRSVRGLRS